ncbi:type II secretion system F family protein [Halobaculum sp. CBA1158]|uniref:type II secretion system F family protein n=1 Tax=Halobaculum sp. CBA1158 TaxID=2904243 RepID=UPI001F45716D|nr:type II secretion system F family protein [Halobaculum sp. CBA1158]UIO98505.1 type II secretion system F family protein [Halobaculum sp. CBA1158]
MVLSYLPLVAALALLAPPVAAPWNRRANLVVTRVAVLVFGTYVAESNPRKHDQQERIRATHMGVTHRMYTSKTLLYATISGVSGSVIGVYAAAATLALLRIGGETIRAMVPPQLGFLAGLTQIGALGVGELFPLLLISSATVGAGSAVAVYLFRWKILDQRAQARAGQVEATLPRTVAFVYALSRSGMSFPVVLNTVTRNEDVYGEAAREIGVAVRDMNTFGTDVLTALERMSSRTPSENMSEFGENLASVLGSGRSLTEFLRGQYDRYQEEAESQQEQYLELLSTFAEAYVTVLVAGPLFFITILVVIGLVLQDTVPILRVVVYAGIPLASVGFVVYIDSITRSEGESGGLDRNVRDPRVVGAANARIGTSATTEGARTDGGVADAGDLGSTVGSPGGNDRWTASRERLAVYDRLERLIDVAGRPLEMMLVRPSLTATLTVPFGLWWVWARTGSIPLSPLPLARLFDSPVIEATLFALLAYGIAYEIDKRRTRAIERAVPDFLDRMASINEAGMTVVESIERLTRSDLDRLTPEVQRAWRDIQWGADASTALERLRDRTGSPMVSRSVALITNAIAASGEVAPVLEIAADEARATRLLRKERRQVMITYLMVIYISFAVFIGIIAALTVAFIPAIEGAQLSGATGGISSPVGGSVSTGGIGDLGGVNIDQYIVLFYHAAAIQGVCSGLIAGQLGEGSVSDGVKHAAVMLLAAYITFVFIG